MAENIRNRLKELEEEFSKIFKTVNEELKKVEMGEASAQAIESIRDQLHALRRRLLAARLEMRAMLREARLKLEEDVVDELEEEVDEFFDKWSDALEGFLDDLKEVARELSRIRSREFEFEDLSRVVEASLQQTAKGLELALSKLRDALEKGFAGPSYVVSSVRLPQRDLEVVDALVEVGVFKSRSEAVAFFAHKGIEASKPLFEEALAKLEELKRAREKLREELQKALGEQTS
jgi:Arc/MetJ-type ribon-helix-helix transcriptional regulator